MKDNHIKLIHRHDNETVEMTLSVHSTIAELAEAFKRFLQASGYFISVGDEFQLVSAIDEVVVSRRELEALKMDADTTC